MVREVLLSKDSNNIQMLKCFSLHNTLHGLVLLLKRITTKPFLVSTVVLDQKTGANVDEKVSVFDFENLANSNSESS